MREAIRSYTVAILLFTGLFSCGPAIQAQDAGESPTPSQAEPAAADELQAEGESLTDQLEQRANQLAELKKAHRSAKGEEKAILASQIRAKRKALAEAVDQLIDHIEKVETEGQDATAYRERARTLLTTIEADLRQAIEQGEQHVIGLLEQRSSAAPDELAALDKEIEERSTAVDEDLTAYLALTQAMDSQGLDTDAPYRFLDTSVQKRAERLAGMLQFLADKRTSVVKSAPGADEEEQKSQAADLKALDERIEATAQHLNATVAIMKERGLETGEYTRLLIESTGELTEDIFQTDVALGLLQGWLESGRQWLIENGPRWLFKLLVFLLILAVFKFLAGITRQLVRRAVTASKLNLSHLLQEQVVSFVGKAVMFIGLLVALSQLGIELAPLLAGLGIAGFIIGFALQDTLSNFASGMMILIYRPYDVGDAVEAGGVMGTVKAMNLVSTTISTWDNQKLVVPNSKIWGDVIRNITAEPQRRVDMTFGIAYADDIDHAERVLWDIVKGNEMVLEDPEPVVRLHTLGESSVDFIVRPWALTKNYWTVYWDITRAVKKRFDAEGISIPFPQRDVHLIREPAASEPA